MTKSLFVIWFVTLVSVMGQDILSSTGGETWMSRKTAVIDPLPKVGEAWFFDDRNPWHRTYYEGTVLAVSNGWVLVKDSLGKTNSWSVGAMGTFHKKTPPMPIASRLSLKPFTNSIIITNYYMRGEFVDAVTVKVLTNTSTNIVITITIQK